MKILKEDAELFIANIHNDLTNKLVEQGAILECIEDILAGREVSDFALSYPMIRQIQDLKDQVREAERENKISDKMQDN